MISTLRWLLLLCVASACARPTTLPPPPTQVPVVEPEAQVEPPESPAEEIVRRIGIVGASSSAGFGSDVALADVIDAALAVEHETFDVSSSAHFLRPIDIGNAEILATTLRGPTLVVAVDFLFWYAYGDKAHELRTAHLEVGLDLLDGFDVPMLVGDLPDVHGASERMISPAQIPSVEELAVFNARIIAWAEARPRVVLLPLSAWRNAIARGAALEVWGSKVELSPELAMQWDGLHPSPRGQALLGLLVLQALEQRFGTLGPALDRDASAFIDRFGSPADGLPPPPQTP